ncbi:GntR family transcriptional regulator [Peribacillus cavernae]|uniref:GntR family transcriptional regulator n=1 Tax=Peribacillus cavernae TaxID=1674310 RepID=A0A433HRM3_9BACI|nr:GntR family transcriptional regulator [Peribacillus cavernae]MDQ0218683.1 DNA-binding GntR family transcriptional regulator [Peribacillus cavernae]RUQ30904.1 GntR family transcriptional regulator [Peribacillus cavernae]
MGETIKNYSLSDQISDLLKDSIIKGELKPGDRLLELEVAKTYNVSQAPVREALSRLRKEGFVIHHRHKGSFVSNFSKKNIEEIYSFREVVEPLAITRAIENLKEEDLKELSRLYEKMLAAGKNNDLDEVRELDNAFHSYIYKLADHEFMYQVWMDLSSVSNRIWYVTSQIYFENLDEIAKLHKPILDALWERDVEKCIEAFNKHMHYVWGRIRQEEKLN